MHRRALGMKLRHLNIEEQINIANLDAHRRDFYRRQLLPEYGVS
jgi:hypothetical protein